MAACALVQQVLSSTNLLCRRVVLCTALHVDVNALMHMAETPSNCIVQSNTPRAMQNPCRRRRRCTGTYTKSSVSEILVCNENQKDVVGFLRSWGGSNSQSSAP